MPQPITLPYPRPEPQRGWFGHLSRRLWVPLVGLAVYTHFALIFERRVLGEDVLLDGSVQALASIFLGALLALRINTAYARWWEGRTLWGGLVNVSRNLAATIATLDGLGPEQRARACELLSTFPGVLAAHLRGLVGPEHAPAQASRTLLTEYRRWREAGAITEVEWYRLCRLNDSLLDICGGCERIKKSPLMRPFRAIVEACVVLYLLSTPLVLANEIWAYLLTMLAGVFFLAMEQVANDIEEPFGIAPDDLPMEDLEITVSASVRQLLA